MAMLVSSLDWFVYHDTRTIHELNREVDTKKALPERLGKGSCHRLPGIRG